MIIDYYDIISLPFRLIILMPLRHCHIIDADYADDYLHYAITLITLLRHY
jgi:hypothetical protein